MAIEPHRSVRRTAVSGGDPRLRSTWGSWRELGASLIKVASLHDGSRVRRSALCTCANSLLRMTRYVFRHVAYSWVVYYDDGIIGTEVSI